MTNSHESVEETISKMKKLMDGMDSGLAVIREVAARSREESAAQEERIRKLTLRAAGPVAIKDEAARAWTRITELEGQVNRLERENQSLREMSLSASDICNHEVQDKMVAKIGELVIRGMLYSDACKATRILFDIPRITDSEVEDRIQLLVAQYVAGQQASGRIVTMPEYTGIL